MCTVMAFFSPGPTEMVIVMAIALLLFGNRLPSVMRSLGRGIVEFKKGVQGIDDETDDASRPPRQGGSDQK
ncbi:MAG: twin-arginine translocase TatA/TatE family subunit [Planctomycetota bacterium]